MSGQGGTKVIFIKKKAKHAAHHGGAWKVAYADFVTAMMALFIVLWLLTQTDQVSRQRISQYFRTGVLPGGSMVAGHPGGNSPPVGVDIFPDGEAGSPGVTAQAKAEAKALHALATSVEQMLQEVTKDPALAPMSAHVSVKVLDEGALIELVDGGDNFLFSVSSSELKPGADTFLQRLGPLLGSVHNKIEIHGHTDARPFDPQSGKTNWDLSFERADKARRVLEANGVASGQINGVLAHADSALYNSDAPYAAENRRLAILVVRGGHEQERKGGTREDESRRQIDRTLPSANPVGTK